MASDEVPTVAYKMEEEADKVDISAKKLELIDLSHANEVDEPVPDSVASAYKLADMASDEVSTVAYKLEEEADKVDIVAKKLELVDISHANEVDEPVPDLLPLDQAHHGLSAAGSSSPSDAWASIDVWRRTLADDMACQSEVKPSPLSDKLMTMLEKAAKKKIVAKLIVDNIPESPVSKIMPDKSTLSKLNDDKSALHKKLSKDWSSSPETGAYASGEWGPGPWSSGSSSLPSSGRYIDTWGREEGAVDSWVRSVTLVTGAGGLPHYSVSFKRADQATIDAARMPGSEIVLESKARLMTFWRSPSSQTFCLNPDEDLVSFGKRTHWSVANVGLHITAEEYEKKMKLHFGFADFVGLDQERVATLAFYLPFHIRFDKVKDHYPDSENIVLVEKYDKFRDLILPGLWQDIYDNSEGLRPLDIKVSLSAILESIQDTISGMRWAGNASYPVPDGIKWWLDMDTERRKQLSSNQKVRKIGDGKMD